MLNFRKDIISKLLHLELMDLQKMFIYQTFQILIENLDHSIFFHIYHQKILKIQPIIRRNVGRVDYVKGIITINPINIVSGKIKDGQTIIEISMALQNQTMLLDYKIFICN